MSSLPLLPSSSPLLRQQQLPPLSSLGRLSVGSGPLGKLEDPLPQAYSNGNGKGGDRIASGPMPMPPTCCDLCHITPVSPCRPPSSPCVWS